MTYKMFRPTKDNPHRRVELWIWDVPVIPSAVVETISRAGWSRAISLANTTVYKAPAEGDQDEHRRALLKALHRLGIRTEQVWVGPCGSRW